MKQIDRAIIKTLVYSDVFDWPLKGWEIQKWLIGRVASLGEIEKGLERLVKQKKIRELEGYYFLPYRKKIVIQRIHNLAISQQFYQKAKWQLMVLKMIPWIKMVAISGGLAVENVEKSDDIDVMVVTAPQRLWLSRLIILGYLELIGSRRKRGEKVSETAEKICTNTLFTTEGLAIPNKNIYTAHEVLQTKVLWSREGVYDQYLENNLWALEWLPNWHSSDVSGLVKNRRKRRQTVESSIWDEFEKMAKNWQLKKMGRVDGEEIIGKEALYFQPVNYQGQVLEEYRDGLKKYQK